MSYVLLWANRRLGPTEPKIGVSRRGLRNEVEKLGERATAAVIALFENRNRISPVGLCAYLRDYKRNWCKHTQLMFGLLVSFDLSWVICIHMNSSVA